MVNEDVTVELFKGSVNCDRYHLLYSSDSVDDSSYYMAYTETGNAFNGFFKPIILNTNYDTIKNSRIGRITIKGMNKRVVGGVSVEQPIYFLVTNINPIRNDKTEIEIEPDAWMNYRTALSIGYDNTLFKATKIINTLPYYEYVGKYKYYSSHNDLFTNEYDNLIGLVHKSSNNTDYVYIRKVLKNTNSPTVERIIQFAENLKIVDNVDTNEIVALYVSPFDLFIDYQSIYGEGWYRTLLETFAIKSIENPLLQTIPITYSPYEKTVILDMNGGIVWQAVQRNAGNKRIKATLNLSYNECYWDCRIEDDNYLGEDIYKSPSNRFIINCVSIPFFSDYYQYYFNLERSFNSEKRQAQLDKQVIDGIGDAVASTLWHGTSSGAPSAGATGIKAAVPATSAFAMAGAAAGSAIQIGLNWYSTNEYNKKLDDIENRQAKLQYDKFVTSSDSYFAFVSKFLKPSYATLRVDSETINARFTYGQPLVDYNCRVSDVVVRDLILNNSVPTNYVNGDFDFCDIPLSDAVQLNQRFKSGVNFTQWA